MRPQPRKRILRIRSSIPAAARARVVQRHRSGAPERVEYLVGRAVVGVRLFDTDGALEFEHGVRRGRQHGRQYRFDRPGRLLSSTSYRHGFEHGLARQWSDAGRLIGTYRMRNGTGVDLWWLESWTKPRKPYLAEVHYMLKGCPHGFEWWLNEGERSVFRECHWSRGHYHGIEREWDHRGKAIPGFPKFYVRGTRVTRRAYERKQRHDPSLPAYRIEDNRPQRIFPPDIERRLGRRRRAA